MFCFEFLLLQRRTFFLVLREIKIKSKIIILRFRLFNGRPRSVLAIFIYLTSLNFLKLLSKHEFLIIKIIKFRILLYLCTKQFFIIIILETKWIIFKNFLFLLFLIKLIFLLLFTLLIFNLFLLIFQAFTL